jgi:phosphonate transport system substrate-binding protein
VTLHYVKEHQMKKPLMMGAVAYAPKVVTIWEGFKEYFRRHDFEFDYLLYSNYERQVEAQFDGSIAIAWNSPLAWVRADRIARAQGQEARAVAMRDTDRDLTSVLVAPAHSAAAVSAAMTDLAGKVVGFGAVDSPQAHLIPLGQMRKVGMIAGRDFTARRFDVLGGKHGDHIGGERDAALALMAGEIDAAWMIDSNHLAFSREGIWPAGTTRIVTASARYDHCNFTVSPGAPEAQINRFTELLLAMRWEDPEVRPLLELEGLKAWLPGRTTGYDALIRATDDERFYDAKGNIIAADYRY